MVRIRGIWCDAGEAGSPEVGYPALALTLVAKPQSVE